MQKGSVLGYDLNEKNCQISYYDENKEEPETMEAAVDNYQIPLILGYYKERWVYGQEAKRLREAGEGDIVTHLFRKAVKRKKVRVGGKIHDGVWLLAKFISMTLKKFEQIDYITFSVPYTNVDMSKMKRESENISVYRENVYLYRIIRKASVSICFISRKNCGNMNQHCFIVMRRKSVHICCAA